MRKYTIRKQELLTHNIRTCFSLLAKEMQNTNDNIHNMIRIKRMRVKKIIEEYCKTKIALVIISSCVIRYFSNVTLNHCYSTNISGKITTCAIVFTRYVKRGFAYTIEIIAKSNEHYCLTYDL